MQNLLMLSPLPSIFFCSETQQHSNPTRETNVGLYVYIYRYRYTHTEKGGQERRGEERRRRAKGTRQVVG